jgi:hypothetical protein
MKQPIPAAPSVVKRLGCPLHFKISCQTGPKVLFIQGTVPDGCPRVMRSGQDLLGQRLAQSLWEALSSQPMLTGRLPNTGTSVCSDRLGLK